MPRTGKIAKLPRPVREELNLRLERADSGRSIVKWLNALPEVKTVLAESFKADPINEQNLTNWRRSGFAAWQTRQDFLDRLQDLTLEAEDLAPILISLTDHASRLLSIHFALLLSPSSGFQSLSSLTPSSSPQSSSSSSYSSSSSSSSSPPSSPPPQSPPKNPGSGTV